MRAFESVFNSMVNALSTGFNLAIFCNNLCNDCVKTNVYIRLNETNIDACIIIKYGPLLRAITSMINCLVKHRVESRCVCHEVAVSKGKRSR